MVVVGGGITGLTAALRLLAGRENILYYPRNPSNRGLSTTGGTLAHLNKVLDTPYSDIA